jgi:hypothetical protein
MRLNSARAGAVGQQMVRSSSQPRPVAKATLQRPTMRSGAARDGQHHDAAGLLARTTHKGDAVA